MPGGIFRCTAAATKLNCPATATSFSEDFSACDARQKTEPAKRNAKTATLPRASAQRPRIIISSHDRALQVIIFACETNGRCFVPQSAGVGGVAEAGCGR